MKDLGSGLICAGLLWGVWVRDVDFVFLLGWVYFVVGGRDFGFW